MYTINEYTYIVYNVIKSYSTPIDNTIKEAEQMIILSAAIMIYALFIDVFTANQTLNNIFVFTLCLFAFMAGMVRYKHILL